MLTRLAHGSDPPERWRELLLCREDDDESKANVARLCSSRLRAHSDLTLSSDPATRRRLLLIRGAPALRHHSHIELAFLSSAARRWIASEYHIDRGLRPGFCTKKKSVANGLLVLLIRNDLTRGPRKIGPIYVRECRPGNSISCPQPPHGTSAGRSRRETMIPRPNQ